MSQSEPTPSSGESPAAPGESSDPARDLAVGLGVVALSIGIYVLWAIVFVTFAATAVGGEPTDTQLSMLDPPALALGVFTATAIYLVHSRHDASFLDVDLPGRRGLLYLVGGVVVLLGLNYGVGFLYELLEIPSPEHSTVQLLQNADPLVAVYFVVISVLLIGPSEELLFRNVLQKRFTESLGWVGAVLVSSALFAVVHTAAYFTEDPVQVLGSLVTVFALSLVLGYVYERTRSLTVVALIHGLYDAVLFALVFYGAGT